MYIVFILSISIFLQFISIFFSLRLVQKQKSKLGWSLLTTAITLMAFRRSLSFYRFLTADGNIQPDIYAELVALTISTLMLVGIIVIFISKSQDSFHLDIQEKEEKQLNRLNKTAIFMVVVSICAFLLVGLEAYRVSRQMVIKNISISIENNVKMLAWYVEETYSNSGRNKVLEQLSIYSNMLNKQFQGAYICALDSQYNFILHTKNRKIVGSSIGNIRLKLKSGNKICTLQDLVKEKKNWVGEYVDTDGEKQISAFFYVKNVDILLAIHIPLSAIDYVIYSAIYPWVISFIIVIFLILPLSVFMSSKSYQGALFMSKRRLQLLRESEAKFRGIFEQAAVGVALINSHTGEFLSVNQKYCEMIGYTFAEMTGGMTFQKITYPDDLQEDLDNMDKLIKNEIQEFSMEKRLYHKDGSIIWINLAVSAAWSEGEGLKYHIAVVEDISKRKNLQAQLLQTQKMESIGALAGGIAHDFNNFLAIISGYTEMIIDNTKEDDINLKRLKLILSAADKSSHLTEQLLLFSRQEISITANIYINDIIRDIGTMLEPLIGKNIKLTLKTLAQLDCVKIDPRLLEQVIINMAVNAKDSMPQGGELLLETTNVILEKNEQPCVSEKGEYLCIKVKDTGIGMDADFCMKIFEPFITTKERGKGTGLGLSTSYGIIKAAKGSISVNSEVGKGTEFNIYLPLERNVVHKEEVKDSIQEDVGGVETILFVDDTADLRDLILNMLQKQGYKVYIASDGEAALEFLEKNKELKVDLLFTDVVMSGMGGWKLSEQIKLMYPKIKVLFTSGYTDDIILRQGIEANKVNFIRKPFKKSQILRKIRIILDS